MNLPREDESEAPSRDGMDAAAGSDIQARSPAQADAEAILQRLVSAGAEVHSV